MINEKIKNLTKVFFRDYSEKLNIIKDNKIDKKSSMFWILVVLIFCLTYISVYIISNLNKRGAPELALKVYLPFVAFVMTFQLIIIVCNLFYYSKDLEYILPLPVKPIEILISKLFTAIGIMYLTEAVFLIIPLFIYWILAAGTMTFLLYSIFLLIFFPIFFTLIIGTLVIILMKFLKKIKNENIIQILIILILTTCLMGGIFWVLSKNIDEIKNTEQIEIINDKLDKINNYFIITNPMIKLLTERNILKNIINIIEIFFIESILFGIFYIIGKRIYYNNLLFMHTKNSLKNKKQYKYKKNKKEIIYLKNEFRKIFRNTTYFSQTLYNYISIIIIFLFLISALIPMFMQEMQVENYEIEELKLQIFCLVLIVIQIISTFNNMAITGISKDGKEAYFIKYIPIDLNRQFKLKLIPQIVINDIMVILVLIVISTRVPQISVLYYIVTFVTATIINVIYTSLMLLLDCKNPNLNWTNEESITKNNNNKIYKYFLTIVFVLILIYFSEIFEQVKFVFAASLMNIFFILILIILNKYINKNINKIFSKIY